MARHPPSPHVNSQPYVSPMMTAFAYSLILPGLRTQSLHQFPRSLDPRSSRLDTMRRALAIMHSAYPKGAGRGDWLSWLERRLDMAEVSGSIPLSPIPTRARDSDTQCDVSRPSPVQDRPDTPAADRGNREMGHRLQARPRAVPAWYHWSSPARRAHPHAGRRRARRPALQALERRRASSPFVMGRCRNVGGTAGDLLSSQQGREVFCFMHHFSPLPRMGEGLGVRVPAPLSRAWERGWG